MPAWSFVGVSARHDIAGASRNLNTPGGLVLNDLLLAVFGFEGVAAGSGPWITGTVQGGWNRAYYQDPAGAGSGLEVWWATWSTGSFTTFNFVGAMTGVCAEAAYRCPLRKEALEDVNASQSWTGDNPVAPAINAAKEGELVFVAAAEELAAGGYTFPAALTERFDAARGGVAGNVQIAFGDEAAPAQGDTGSFTLTATSAGGADEGATGTCGFFCPGGVQLPFMHAGP